MTPPRKQSAAAILLLLSSFAPLALAQTKPPASPPPAKPPLTVPFTPQPKPAPPAPPRTLILLDPAHGGPDTGAHLPGNLLEKDITLAFNNRLRALLTAANFAVISTRTSDPSTLFTTDQRAEIANHARAAVCLILHATGSGSGVHLFTSALTTAPARPPRALQWDTAQGTSVADSRLIAAAIRSALTQARLPATSARASIRPLDNLTCPAIAIEIAPLADPSSSPTSVSDSAYQQHIAEAIVAALTGWRTANLTGADR